ncbi:TetR/AcrR family transcriptional regulator [Rhodococcus opacus]|uniref:TetR/AcrR family transcriptional regulator n=1 Tax=Rhodococcus opacus TaxID=37919 RepID=UPI001C471A0D|nr:TetR/AcrR family transcriptional regulator [Rhodococcus opacus]MBV6762311.1 TetR/AcrR family transcriptional regulator [Rhodococcus opacus]
MPEGGAAESRLERRKARTRASLIRAAQSFIAEGNLNVPVLEITRTADVGMGSFYNHFDSKEQLYRAAVDAALEAHGQLLDHLTGDLDDSAETFAQSFRLTGRLFRREPDLSRVLLNNAPALITADRGLAPRALRDIEAATAAGRFTVRDPELAVVLTAGALMGLGQLLHDRPDRDDAEATDTLAEDLLRTFGLCSAEARTISHRRLPDIGTVSWGGTAA